MLKILAFLLLPAMVWAQGRMAVRELAGKVVDLPYPLSARFPNFEGAPQSPYHAEVTGAIEKNGYFSRRYRTQEHFGTHMDAPAHFGPGQRTVDQLAP